MVPLVCSWEYFPDKKATLTGIILCGFGFGPSVFGFLALAIANPDNLQPDLEVEGGKIYTDPAFAERIPGLLRTLFFVYLGMAIFSVLTITRCAPDAPVNQDDASGRADSVTNEAMAAL